MKQLNILIIFALTFCLLNVISNKSSMYYKVHSYFGSDYFDKQIYYFGWKYQINGFFREFCGDDYLL